jgi:hypothetical protein
MIADLLKRKYSIATLVDATWAPGDRTFQSSLEKAKASPTDAILALGETPRGCDRYDCSAGFRREARS